MALKYDRKKSFIFPVQHAVTKLQII